MKYAIAFIDNQPIIRVYQNFYHSRILFPFPDLSSHRCKNYAETYRSNSEKF